MKQVKPIKVKMQAFGPYLKETCCDFTKLRDGSLFLITGSTGSGKTTILDAMSFSLYGYATGLMRTFKDMRNTAAPDSLETRTEFEFSLAGSEYKFIRTIKVRIKRSGEREETPEAECYVKENGSFKLIESGDKKVRNAASELLGFTHSQFSQVIVLPQGEFRKLLLAGSKEKAEILQTLFATARWQNISDTAAQESRKLKAEFEEISVRSASLLQSVGAASADELSEGIHEAKKELKSLTDESVKYAAETEKLQKKYDAARALAAKFSELKSAAEEYESLEKRTAEIQRLSLEIEVYDKMSAARPYLDALKNAGNILKKREDELARAESIMQRASAEYGEKKAAAQDIDSITLRQRGLYDEIAVCRALLPDIQICKDMAKKTAHTEKGVSLLIAEKEKLVQGISVLEERIEKNKEHIENSYKKYIEDFPAILQEYSSIKERLLKYGEYKNAVSAAESAEKVYLTEQEKMRSADLKFKQAEQNAASAEHAFLENAAYRLAGSLSDDTPCPVCGSLHHPALAARPAHVADDEEIKRLKSLIENFRSIYNNAVESTARAKAAYDAANEKKASLAGLAGENENLLQSRAGELEKFIREAEDYKQIYSRQRAALSKLEEENKASRRRLEEVTSGIAGAKSELSSLRAKQEEIERRLPAGLDISELEKKTAQLQNEAENLTKQIEILQKALEQSVQKLNKAQAEHRSAINGSAEAKEAFNSARCAFVQRCESLELDEDTASKELPPKEDIAAVRQNIEEYKSRLNLVRHRISALKEELNGCLNPDLKTLEAGLREKQEKQTQLAQLTGSIKQKLQSMESVLHQLSELAQKNEKTAEKIDRYSRISDMLMGRNLHRTTIQGFVLGLMLDEVVLAACRYLDKLSMGRFALIRVDTEGGTSHHGLDIEVLDAHMSSQRKICTLSGGELFLASLSLAFGLAEVVQSYSGGIHFDSIFIDEGFGTLDAQTLSLAMDAFEEVRRDGRMVGIISHVEELSDRIGARIEVKATASGSDIHIIQ